MTEEALAVSDDADTITDIFDDEPETTETESTDEVVETGTEKGEDKPGETEESTDDAKVETPSTESDGLQAALIAERRKRQEAERKLKETAEPETVPDPIEDPTGYAKHIESKADKNLLGAKIDLSRDVMMDSKDDYLEKEKVFMGLIGEETEDGFNVVDINLFKQFKDAKNPARFAYDHATHYLDIQEKSSPDYRDKLKNELREELLAELKSEGISAVDVPDLTKSGAGSNSSVVEKDYSDIGDVFAD